MNNKFCIKCCCGYPDNPFITREALNRLQSENFQKNEQLFKTWTFPIYLMMTVLISLHLIWYLLINTKELCKHISLRRKIWSVIGFLAIPRKYDIWRESFLSLVRRERTGLWLVACRILLVTVRWQESRYMSHDLLRCHGDLNKFFIITSLVRQRNIYSENKIFTKIFVNKELR